MVKGTAMADPNQLRRQERRLVEQIHLAKLATEQRLIPRRTGRLGSCRALS
jgi:hypothetical protein